MSKMVMLYIATILALNSDGAYVKRDVESTTHNILESFQNNMEVFKKCVDDGLAKSVNDVSTNQLQPVFSVIGDQINRFSKALQDLTGKSTTQDPIWSS